MMDWYTFIMDLSNPWYVLIPTIVTVLSVELWMLYKLFREEPEDS